MDNATQTDRVGMYYRSLTDDENNMIYKIKELGQEFLDTVDELGDSEEIRQARARMEEAVMWAVKHVAN